MDEFGCKSCCKDRLGKAVKDLIDTEDMLDYEHNIIGLAFGIINYALDEGSYHVAATYADTLRSIYDQSDKESANKIKARYPKNQRVQWLLGELGRAAGDCYNVIEKRNSGP
jgi:hypothetical protein